VEGDLAKLDNNIAVTIRELERASESAEGQKALLKKRIRVMYENGNIGYLSVLLDSTSFSDFIVRLDFLKKIVEHDNKLLKEANDYRNNIEETKKQLQMEQEQKAALKNEISNKKQQMEKLKVDKQKTVDTIEDNLEQLENQLDKLLKESEELAKLIVAAQSKSKYIEGEMCWPSPGYFRITSQYGYRIHPKLKVKKMHTGIDIGVPSGNNIVAANDGKVIYSDYYGGYGYAVIIDHGGKISTLYAHNSKLLVSVGDKVKKGETIAKSGSTGLSTGPHLHFEIRENGQHVDPMKYFKSK
jgi:murein DD-endopeptidase MepM/ murein hydrolase activator NlpD